MCWGMTISASLVVIMGTQYYDASGASGGADYSVTDLLQMMGRASRPDIDDAGRSAPSPSLPSLSPSPNPSPESAQDKIAFWQILLISFQSALQDLACVHMASHG